MQRPVGGHLGVDLGDDPVHQPRSVPLQLGADLNPLLVPHALLRSPAPGSLSSGPAPPARAAARRPRVRAFPVHPLSGTGHPGKKRAQLRRSLRPRPPMTWQYAHKGPGEHEPNTERRRAGRAAHTGRAAQPVRPDGEYGG
ncbi:hypothetical protein GCM10009642_65100 [Nocardiopsis metallicus]